MRLLWIYLVACYAFMGTVTWAFQDGIDEWISEDPGDRLRPVVVGGVFLLAPLSLPLWVWYSRAKRNGSVN